MFRMREEVNHNDTQGKISAGTGSCKGKGPGVESHWCFPGGHGEEGTSGGDWNQKWKPQSTEGALEGWWWLGLPIVWQPSQWEMAGILLLSIDWMCIMKKEPMTWRFVAEQLKCWSCSYSEGKGLVRSVQFWRSCLRYLLIHTGEMESSRKELCPGKKRRKELQETLWFPSPHASPLLPIVLCYIGAKIFPCILPL